MILDSGIDQVHVSILEVPLWDADEIPSKINLYLDKVDLRGKLDGFACVE